MSLHKLSIEANLPQFCVDQIAAGDNRITFEASDLEKLTFKVWNVYEDVPGQFQLMVTFQGHCLGNYELQPLPEDLKTIKDQHGYFKINGYLLEVAEDISEDVATAMSKFAEWTKQNKGIKNPENVPSLFFKVTSAEALVQLMVTSSYNKSTQMDELSFNGWAYQGISWAGHGIGATSPVKLPIGNYTRRQLPPVDSGVPPVVPPPPAIKPR